MHYSGLITENIYEPRLRYPGRKGIYPVIDDHNERFRRLSTKPIIANDLDLDTPEGKDLFNRLVYTKYDGDVFSNVPTCACGHLHDGDVYGEICDKCGQPALPHTELSIESLIWLRVPPEAGKFMNPTVYGLLKAVMKRGTLSVLDWLIDPRYRPPVVNSHELDLLKELNIPRGLAYFSSHFDEIIHTLAQAKRRITKASGNRSTITLIAPKKYEEILELCALYRERFFSEYLPFPSKLAFVIEQVGKQTFVDEEMSPAINALLSIVKTEKDVTNVDTINSRVARVIRDLRDFYVTVDENKSYGKEGVYRKLVYGFEPHYTLRAVITSLHKPHDHRTIILPWGGSILMLKPMIANKLLLEDYTPNEINSLIYDNIHRKNPKLDRILDILIAETEGGAGLDVLNTRFPSLYHGSTQHFKALVERDPSILSIQIPLSACVAYNGDFDGDYQSIMLGIDQKMVSWMKRMAPYTGLMDLTVPYKISNNPKPVVPLLDSINNMLEITEQECVPYG